jgi:hypothetical protein
VGIIYQEEDIHRAVGSWRVLLHIYMVDFMHLFLLNVLNVVCQAVQHLQLEISKHRGIKQLTAEGFRDSAVTQMANLKASTFLIKSLSFLAC